VTELPNLISMQMGVRASPKPRLEADMQPANSNAARLVVVSNRVADLSAKYQSGGLAVAVGDALKGSHGLWFGWSGETSEHALDTPPKIEMHGALKMAKLDLTPDEEEGYYYGYANRCVWPALHYRLDLARCSETDAEIYFKVNARFADALMPLLETADTIWVHDYHLIPLAEELRARGCVARIGFFLHTPFPSPEVFAAVPHQERLGRALMVYNLVGFQTQADRENFARYVLSCLDGERLRGDLLTAHDRTTKASVFPIGIAAEDFAKLAESESAKGPLLPLPQEDMKTIIGVDRLDYTKGLPERLRAFEALLSTYPIHRRRVRLVQIGSPTRETLPIYQEVREEVERLVGRINGRFGDLSWTPVTYLHRTIPQHQLARLYRESAVGLVTALRDGMNLVAKEYVAAQHGKDPGILMLSRFAGAAEELKEALLINPHDTNEMAKMLNRALKMRRPERWARHHQLMQRIEAGSVTHWRDAFLAALSASNASSVYHSGHNLGAA
jgi:trehalose 6-phosphate synthase